jgi:hypothetical protein
VSIGSFTVDGKTISVESDYNHIDGVTYQLVQADSKEVVAVTTYRGLDVAEGVTFSEKDLNAGLRSIVRKAVRS